MLNEPGETSALHIQKVCRRNGLEIGDRPMELLSAYVSLLQEWNKKINLVSRRDEENIWYAHLLHSLSPLFFLTMPPGASILDLGSGGGLPGIPLAIVCPEINVLLLDSIGKKTKVAREYCGTSPASKCSCPDRKGGGDGG